jgi:AcrR family transcriptional regulator
MTESAPRSERRYGGQSAEQRRADRRRRLLDAGLDRFGTKGFRGTTVTDLCRAAGVAPIHFYEEYASREALLEAVYDEIMDSTRAEVDAALARCEPGNFRQHTRAGLDAFCHMMLDDPRRARVQCIEIVGVSPALETRRHQGLLRYASLVVDSFLLIGEDEPVRPDPGLMTVPAVRSIGIALVGGVNAALVDWLLEEEPPAISGVVDAMSDMFIATGEYLARGLG